MLLLSACYLSTRSTVSLLLSLTAVSLAPPPPPSQFPREPPVTDAFLHATFIRRVEITAFHCTVVPFVLVWWPKHLLRSESTALRAGILNSTYGKRKNLSIYLVLRTIVWSYLLCLPVIILDKVIKPHSVVLSVRMDIESYMWGKHTRTIKQGISVEAPHLRICWGVLPF